MDILEKIKGTWLLDSWTYRDGGGDEKDYFGPGPGGILMFDGRGRMNVQVHRSDRSRFGSEGILGGEPEEISAAFTSYFAYYGTYEKGEEPDTVVNIVEGALFPNWVGDKQVRYVSVQNDYLLLTTPPVLAGEEVRRFTLKWKRSDTQ
ncbi:lipocalin-like domain-containing protein [Roseivirga sp. BDSF3-8]|uniref:lipocalin-like domain-containing protein n=1 Tax=Roseivirga sp. BDSF3-8 TaxID=3241598 RepID=UPI003531A29F